MKRILCKMYTLVYTHHVQEYFSFSGCEDFSTNPGTNIALYSQRKNAEKKIRDKGRSTWKRTDLYLTEAQTSISVNFDANHCEVREVEIVQDDGTAEYPRIPIKFGENDE